MYIPYYSINPAFDFLDRNNEDARDIMYIKRMYPKAMNDIQKIVEDECDKLEYDGSIMFDEYPDKLMLQRKSRKIYERVMDINEGKCPCKDEDWLKDTISYILYNEMYRRRCRRRKRRIY